MSGSQDEGRSCIENNKEQEEVLLLGRSRIENPVVLARARPGGHNEHHPHEGLFSVQIASMHLVRAHVNQPVRVPKNE